jgi:hypothetical protein
LAKSLAGDTTLAAMLTDTVAIATPATAMTATTMRITPEVRSGSAIFGGASGEVRYPSSTTGSNRSLIGTPWRIFALALVMMTPIAANAIIVVGSPSACPLICSRWLRP